MVQGIVSVIGILVIHYPVAVKQVTTPIVQIVPDFELLENEVLGFSVLGTKI